MRRCGKSGTRSWHWSAREAEVALDPLLLEILACPCPKHRELRVGTGSDPQADVLQCCYCLTTFPVRDDIPVMLLDEATPGPRGIGEPATSD